MVEILTKKDTNIRVDIVPILNESKYTHYEAYDAAGNRVLHNEHNITHIRVSEYCEKVCKELTKRLSKNPNGIIITMKHSNDVLTIKPNDDTITISGGIYETPMSLSNIYAVSDAIIHYEEDRYANILAEEAALADTYDDGVFDEYLTTLHS